MAEGRQALARGWFGRFGGWRRALGLLAALVFIGLVAWRMPRLVGAYRVRADLLSLEEALRLPRPRSDEVAEATRALMSSLSHYDGADADALSGRIGPLETASGMDAASMHVGLARFYTQTGDLEEAELEYRRAMLLVPGHIPDRDFADYYSLVMRRDPADPIARFLLARYSERVGRSELALDSYRWLIEHGAASGLPSGWLAQSHYRLGLHYEETGQRSLAVAHHESALYLDKRSVGAMARLEELYRSSGQPQRADEIRRRLQDLSPEVVVDQPVNEAWTLLGYDLDELALSLGVSIDVTLYWQSGDDMQATECSGEGWHRGGDRCIQTVVVANLVPNAGFEENSFVGRGIPIGWQPGVYPVPTESYRLVADSVPWGETTALLLLGETDQQRMSVCSRDIVVNPEATYLAAGWMRNASGVAGQVTLVWLVEGRRRYAPAVTSDVSGSWAPASAVVFPSDGANRGLFCFVNADPAVETYVDNGLLIELILPSRPS